MKLNRASFRCFALGIVLAVSAGLGAGNEAYEALAVFATPLLFLAGSILAFIAWRKGTNRQTSMVALMLNLLSLGGLIVLVNIWINGFADMLN